MLTSTPVSFSNNYHQSLESLVEQALISLECPPEQLTGFRSHSSIHLEFDALPDISISIENDRLWLWSAFSELTPTLITQQAAELFTLLQQSIPNIELDQAVLVQANQGYELKALVDPSCLHLASNLGMVLEYFYQKVADINQLFDQKL
ncbi:InvB/SpaK family type III secretion system chaperone [Shewanella surugensis]|uniref:Uncharacterized protein n=1 Tax=Shewanella surugensis TaxID=212020 RepID=A0ABT0LD89_9GAMM|nr:hypothetical protein [Shewanella surugensis]MCL1125653.1 hypothetical protein [Shewanella surugensis]